MSDRENLTDWRDLREFRHVDLEASHVLGWQLSGDTLQLDLDLKLEPGHAFYESPRPAEKVCFRPAALEFPHCDSIFRPDDGAGADMGALVASLSPGQVDGLVVYGDGVFELSGKFGTVVIDAGRPVLRLIGTWSSRRSDTNPNNENG